MNFIAVFLILVISITLSLCCPQSYSAYNSYPAYSNYDQAQGVYYRNSDQNSAQAMNSYDMTSKQRRPISYGPFYIQNYGRPFHMGRPRSNANQPYEGEYLAHMLLANQMGSISNDHMAQLIYDNSNKPQQVSRNAYQTPCPYCGSMNSGLYNPERSMPYNLYEDASNYYIVPNLY